ncbi:basic leucine zipper 8 [Prunus yedoensis var. nudiflora]|uniref:Basic leucine zipper 8 n=1 Tax=Prunus yedoensis var. nudiflora TaxID=2094558 RepID=A0A314XQW8_PRUYE|nr:basic leucine zipper 8 [Prunus yedoensis var. nudiflora]
MDNNALPAPKFFACGGTHVSLPFNDKYSAPPLRSFPFLLLSSSSLGYTQMIMSFSAMLFNHEPVHFNRFECPVQETGLTTDEIQELLSLLQEGNSASPNSCSEGSNRAVYSVDEKKLRRKTSNRESARRSRWRKKRHFEDLTNDVNRLKVENRELKNRLGVVAQKCHVTWRENDRLTSEP